MRSVKKTSISDDECLVAYIDIMGFASEIKQAKTQKHLLDAYNKIRFVQEAFDHPSASDNPAETKELNKQYGRRVIALSDAIIVVFNPKNIKYPSTAFGDLFGLFFSDLSLAQGQCVNRGIFLRGALAIGTFHYAKNVLLSPALAIAYELESKGVVNPVIVMPEYIRNKVDETCALDPWENKDQPGRTFFRQYGKRKWLGERLFYLDYLGIMLNEVHSGYSKKERVIMAAANKAERYSLVDKVKARNFRKSAALYLKQHRQTLEEAFKSAPSKRIRKKYLWLMKYHNRSFRKDILFVKDQVTDVAKFENML